MREITSPVGSLLLSQVQLHPDFQILHLQDLARPSLIHLLRLAINQQFQGFRLVLRDKGDRDLLGVDLGDARVSDGAEDATPVRVLAVEGGLDKGRCCDGRGYCLCSLERWCSLVRIEKSKGGECLEFFSTSEKENLSIEFVRNEER